MSWIIPAYKQSIVLGSGGFGKGTNDLVSKNMQDFSVLKD